MEGFFILEGHVGRSEQGSRHFGKTFKDTHIGHRDFSKNFIGFFGEDPTPVDFVFKIRPFFLFPPILLNFYQIAKSRAQIQFLILELKDDCSSSTPPNVDRLLVEIQMSSFFDKR